MYLSQDGIEMFRGFFKELLDADGGAVLWHCVSGKDRTGNATMLLLTVLGVEKETIIQDRTIFEGVYIFVANNYAMGNLSERDFRTYMDLFELMMSLVKAPDLMIYLKSSIPHLVSQIQKRGRDYEQSISIEYLAGLNQRYEKWISEYKGKLIIIEADNMDFLNRPEDFAKITDRIDAELYGLF
jgi:deoxyadenosine/deoxycytidine kinase